MNAIYWLRNDLRLHDNAAFQRACAQSPQVLPVYILNETQKTGPFRAVFLQESLLALRKQLQCTGNDIYITNRPVGDVFSYLQKELNTNLIYTSYEYAYNEKQEIIQLINAGFEVICIENHTLTSKSLLPFALINLPDVFTEFRKRAEAAKAFMPMTEEVNLSSCLPAERIAQLKYACTLNTTEIKRDPRSEFSFSGGEQEGLKRLHYYLYESHAVKKYKQTRNDLSGAGFSTKLSAWLSAGCLSPRKICTEIKAYEENYGANESTYWVIFELLWRDYFKYVADRYGKSFFHAGGLHHKPVTPHFNRTLFEQWKEGKTGNDFIDANMIELKTTGFMSNRGRQNVASYLVNDLKSDWRSGAAWFEEMLIDYDACSNWGNWLYLTGVGNDPRKDRYFNTESQAQRYDASGEYRKRWLNK